MSERQYPGGDRSFLYRWGKQKHSQEGPILLQSASGGCQDCAGADASADSAQPGASPACTGPEQLKASVTVFLSLICMVFLALLCAVTESARIQGARAQTAYNEGLGNMSVLAEFEKSVLDRYELFVLDGAYGSGIFAAGKVKERLQVWLEANAKPASALAAHFMFDPWQLELTDCSIRGYELLTDSSGAPFYQQAVDYMRSNFGLATFQSLTDFQNILEEAQRGQEEYEQKRKENEEALKSAERQKEQVLEEAESAGRPLFQNPFSRSNPLIEIAKLQWKDLLSLVTGNAVLSSRSLLQNGGLPSRGRGQAGTMYVPEKYGGVLDDLIFREYLLSCFPNYTDKNEEGCLAYQAEYLIAGQMQDKSNLRTVARKLLLMREGLNYLYCVADARMGSQTGALAVALTGWTGIPALTAATQHALLLAWAYGESLLDVRCLLSGGRVPLRKSPGTWVLHLESLGRLSQILRGNASSQSSGLSYREYLRLLLLEGNVTRQRLLALDLIQENMRMESGMAGFRAQNCIVSIDTSSHWHIRPVFFRAAASVMGIAGQEVEVTQAGQFTYQPQ